MNHLHFQANATAQVDGDKITLDFSGMPLSRLVALHRLNVGMNAKNCDSWTDASTSAMTALTGYLDQELNAVISAGNDFTIVIRVGDPSSVVQHVIDFFSREHITVVVSNGVRRRELASA